MSVFVLGAGRQRKSDPVSALEKLRDKRIITFKFMKTVTLHSDIWAVPG